MFIIYFFLDLGQRNTVRSRGKLSVHISYLSSFLSFLMPVFIMFVQLKLDEDLIRELFPSTLIFSNLYLVFFFVDFSLFSVRGTHSA